MAAAIGIGIDVEAPQGNMIVDIGGGSTEIAVISLGGIVSNNSIRIAGTTLADIQEYMSRQHNVRVSERMAERIKIHVGAALTELGEDAPEDYIVYGPNRITALADGGPGVLSGGGALHGEEYRPYRDGCLERVGEYAAAGIVCRHRAQRYLPDGWRSFVAWFGQTVDRQDQHSVPHRRRSVAQCGQRHRYSIEEREQLFLF